MKVLSLWRHLSHNWVVTLVNKFVVLLVVGSVILLVWRFRQLPPMIPLWYSRSWGAEQLAPALFLALLPLSSALWHIVTIIISVALIREYLVFIQVLFLSSLLVSFLSFVTLVKILFLVS